VVPAHNEERAIERLLDALLAAGDPLLDVVVVCNGCTDRTVEVARAHGPQVRVLELAEAGKPAALVAGAQAARHVPLLYVDADVVLHRRDVDRLCAGLEHDAVLASAPERQLVMEGVSAPVRWYYDVWSRLPQVQEGLFGRGVVALTAAGAQRLRGLPPLMSDDLAASEAFTAAERLVVRDAEALIRPPRTLADLLRRRVRVVTGNAQADAGGVRQEGSRTTARTLASMSLRNPRLVPRIVVFLAVTLAARMRARRAVARGDFDTWLRDESSRAG
jgi:glycosyltransferase involved in cell wall biosynthesis